MSVSLRDIADKLQVSQSTVSKALNNRPGVSDDLRQRIIETAESMNFRPRKTVRGVMKDTSVSVSLILRSNEAFQTDPFYSLIAEALAHELQGFDIASMLTVLHESPSKMDQVVDFDRMDGLAVIGASLTPDFLDEVRTLDVPTVLVDNQHYGLSSVNMDNRGGARQAVAHLADSGHEVIVCLMGPQNQFSQSERYLGYRAGLKDAGLSVNSGQLLVADGVGVDDGYAALMEQHEITFSGLFAATDKLAIGAMKALHERGYTVGQDVSVIGFDDIEWGMHTSPALSTIRIPKQQIGRMAAQILQNLIVDADLVPMSLEIATQLVVRESTAPPNQT